MLPALLAVLGPRINALRIPLPGRNRQTGQAGDPSQQVWAAVTRVVMRRPVHYLAAVVAVLAILAIPLGHAHFGGLDERILPPGSQPRMVTARIQTEFRGGTADPIQVVLRGVTPLQAQQLATRIQAQRGITGVARPGAAVTPRCWRPATLARQPGPRPATRSCHPQSPCTRRGDDARGRPYRPGHGPYP